MEELKKVRALTTMAREFVCANYYLPLSILGRRLHGSAT
jgi:hypothetical protein